jgi:hypothetical protein
MKIEQIIEVIKDLAKSQGFYGRLLNDIENMSDGEFAYFKEVLEEQNFKDAVDLIIYLEG